MESYLKKDIDLLEGVQHRATKMILGYQHYCYEDRLALCQLSTLKGRRLRGDLIQAFKLLKGLDQINYNNFLVLDGKTSMRGHTLKLLSARLDCIVLAIESLIVGIIFQLKSLNASQ